MRSSFVFLSVLGLALAPACTSVDAERTELREALHNAGGLAVEINGWEGRSTGAVSETVVDTINNFQSRADQILDTITGISDNAKTGCDLSGVKQALTEIIEFDTSQVADASEVGRSSIVQQFGQLAESLERAVASTGRV